MPLDVIAPDAVRHAIDAQAEAVPVVMRCSPMILGALAIGAHDVAHRLHRAQVTGVHLTLSAEVVGPVLDERRLEVTRTADQRTVVAYFDTRVGRVSVDLRLPRAFLGFV